VNGFERRPQENRRLRKTTSVQTEEKIARDFRKRLGVDHQLWLDPLTILMKLKRQVLGFGYAIVPSSQIAPALAKWDSGRKLIYIGRDTFAAANGPKADGRARFSIFHEAMHVLSGHKGGLNRLHSRYQIPRYATKLRELEANIDKITAAFMAPRHLVRDGWSARDIAFRFGMSAESSNLRIEEIRGRTRHARARPDSIAQLLLDLNKPSRR